MTAKDPLKYALQMSRMVTEKLLADLGEADLLARVVPGANHVAWQLGHLIVSENGMVNGIKSEAAPALPAGFAESHGGGNHDSDDPGQFCSKEQYLQLLKMQREATVKLLDEIDTDDLNKPGPEQVREIAPTVGAVFALIALHETVHAGQYTPLRRLLGKPDAF